MERGRDLFKHLFEYIDDPQCQVLLHFQTSKVDTVSNVKLSKLFPIHLESKNIYFCAPVLKSSWKNRLEFVVLGDKELVEALVLDAEITKIFTEKTSR